MELSRIQQNSNTETSGELFANSSPLILITDLNGNLVEVNQLFLKFLEFSKEEIIGKNILEIDLLTMIDNKYLVDKESFIKGKQTNLELLLKKRNDGFIKVRYFSERLSINDEKLILNIFINNKEFKFPENLADNENVDEKNIETEKFFKSKILANITHEIRTPMNGIIGFINLLSRTNLLPVQENYIKKAKASADYLMYIINDILDYSKMGVNSLDIAKVNCNLYLLIDEVIDIYAVLAKEKGIILKTLIKSNVPEFIECDPYRLKQVISNILNNAVKFTEEGEITFTVNLINENNQFGIFKFVIEDTGPGINSEEIYKIFEPFVQFNTITIKRYEGTGLGLTIAKEIIEKMDGEIRVESILDKGSKFIFTIKAKIISQTSLDQTMEIFDKEYEECSNDIDESTNTGVLTAVDDSLKPKILIAEDNEMNANLMVALLREINLDCDVVENGFLAVEAAKYNDYDIIFMDCYMPEMDGYEATIRIRKNEVGKKHARIIAMTANVMAGEEEKCYFVGMDDYIGKPINMDRIFTILKEFIKV